MPYALLSSLWISVLLLFGTVFSGVGFFGKEAWLRNHLVFALTAVMLSLFAHTMTMFYFIGTGKKIKDFMAEWDEESRRVIRQKIIVMKRKLFPWMMLVCAVIMAAFILGGAADARVVKPMVHTVFAYASLFIHVHVSALESIYIFRNIQLIHEVNLLAQDRETRSLGKRIGE